MGMLFARMSEEKRTRLTPILEEVVAQVVTTLKNEIRHWRWGNEFVNGLGTHTEAVNTGPTRLEEERDKLRLQATYWPMVLTSYPNFFHLAQTWLWWNGNDKQNMLHKNRVRPYFVAHAAMTDLLGAGRFVERLDLPGAVMHLRERSVRPGLVAVMWSTGPEAVVKLEVGSESVEVADVMGKRRPLATPGGVATLALTPMPQYLLGASVVRPAP